MSEETPEQYLKHIQAIRIEKECSREEPHPLKDAHCPNCDHPLTEPINDIWKDPQVKEALKDGRSADDIAILRCPECNRTGYYNQGSYFTCRFCDKTFYVLTEGEEYDGPTVQGDEMISLADTVTETTEGYDNRTL